MKVVSKSQRGSRPIKKLERITRLPSDKPFFLHYDFKIKRNPPLSWLAWTSKPYMGFTKRKSIFDLLETHTWAHTVIPLPHALISI